MNTIIAYALLGGGVAALAAAVVWLAGRYLGLSKSGQKFGNLAAIPLALIAVRVVDVQALIGPTDQAAQFERVVQRNPALRVLKELYPTEYAPIRAAILQGVSEGKGELEILNEIRPFFQATAKRQSLKAGDANLNRLLRIAIEQAQATQALNPQYCNELLNTPTRLSFNPTDVLPQALQDAEFALIADILRETVNSPEISTPALSEETAGEWAIEAFEGLTPAHAAALTAIDFEAASARSPVEHAASCAFTLAMLKSMAQGSPSETAQRFRAVMAIPAP